VSTGLIIAIIVIAIILVGLLVLLPRMRRQAELKKRERELSNRREAAAGEHRQVADTREREADKAEREARIAQKEAERQRAEAGLHQERATMAERGDADHELIDENERDRFAGTSADPEAGTNGASTGTPAGEAGEGSRTEFEQGREVGHEEERTTRFDRDGEASATEESGSRRAP
jgi:FtsZ-interacting cell division protein ZipA